MARDLSYRKTFASSADGQIALGNCQHIIWHDDTTWYDKGPSYCIIRHLRVAMANSMSSKKARMNGPGMRITKVFTTYIDIHPRTDMALAGHPRTHRHGIDMTSIHYNNAQTWHWHGIHYNTAQKWHWHDIHYNTAQTWHWHNIHYDTAQIWHWHFIHPSITILHRHDIDMTWHPLQYCTEMALTCHGIHSNTAQTWHWHDISSTLQ